MSESGACLLGIHGEPVRRRRVQSLKDNLDTLAISFLDQTEFNNANLLNFDLSRAPSG